MATQQSRPCIRFINTFEPVSRHYRDLFPYFIEKGWAVEVVISRAQYRKGRDEAWILPEIRVRWIPSLRVKPDGMLTKFMVMLTFIVFGAGYMLLGPGVEKNVFLTQPPLFALLGYLLRKLRGQAYYQIVMDIYPDIAIQMGLMSASSPVTKLLMRLSRFSLRHADGLVVIGRCMQQRVIGMGIRPEKVTFIPNWSNYQSVQPVPHEDNLFRHQHGWAGKFVIVFAGNIGIPQYFDDMLEVCRRFRERSDFLFALIGNGLRRQEIDMYQRDHGLDNIVLLPFQPYGEQSNFLSAGDLHLVSLRLGIEGLAVPSKTYSILAAGRPIIYQGHPSGEIARLVEEEDVGRFVPLNNPDMLENVILEYMNNANTVRHHGHNARQLSEGKLHHQTICKQYAITLGI